MKLKKSEVLALLDAGHSLIRIFHPRVTEYRIDRKEVNKRAAEIIINSGEVTLGKMEFGGMTKHYYLKEKAPF